jgi:hypothetical protein
LKQARTPKVKETILIKDEILFTDGREDHRHCA